jgi:acetyl esterase/lipase
MDYAMNSSPPSQDRSSASTAPTEPTVLRDLPYVENGHARQKLDLYLPAQGDMRPLIVWIHGGAFRMGSKEGSQHDIVPLPYVARGFAVASINYRLSQHAIFPAQIEDCKSAVRWLRAHARDYGLDADRVAAWGPSAGGHLSSMLGTTGATTEFDVGAHLDRSSAVQCVVDWFGPTDFLQMDAQRLPDGMIHDDADSPESELVGGPIQENPDKVARANPITYVGARTPPFLILHGDHDPLVPYGQSLLFVDALEAAGVDVTFYTVKGGGHGQFTDPQVAVLTADFLDKQLSMAR